MSDNWVVQNLENALNTWNEKLAEIWQLITQSPENFKGGAIWNVIVDIHGAVQAIGLALLVLFFVVGVMRTCGNFAEVKRPEQALKLFIRFALAKGAVTYGLELMMALFKIVQGIISTIMNAAGFGAAQQTVLPQEIVTAVEDCGFFESIPLWAVTLIGGLFITVLSFIMIMSSCLPVLSSPCLLLPRLSLIPCGGGHNGMELYRGACIQYARLSRCSQDGRPCCQRNDGLVKEEQWNGFIFSRTGCSKAAPPPRKVRLTLSASTRNRKCTRFCGQSSALSRGRKNLSPTRPRRKHLRERMKCNGKEVRTIGSQDK